MVFELTVVPVKRFSRKSDSKLQYNTNMFVVKGLV